MTLTTEMIRAGQDTAPQLSAVEIAAVWRAMCAAAPVAAQAQPQPSAITLSGAQLLQALDFIAPDRDTDASQLEGDVSIVHGDGHAGSGYYAYMSDYPDEGAVLLDGEIPAQQPVSGADGLPWENFPSYLIDKCEGETITEEGIQRALAAMLKDQKYASSQPQPSGNAGELDEQSRFEKCFPLPSNCVRAGTGYAATAYGAWAASEYMGMWEGWKARAARAAEKEH